MEPIVRTDRLEQILEVQAWADAVMLIWPDGAETNPGDSHPARLQDVLPQWILDYHSRTRWTMQVWPAEYFGGPQHLPAPTTLAEALTYRARLDRAGFWMMIQMVLPGIKAILRSTMRTEVTRLAPTWEGSIRREQKGLEHDCALGPDPSLRMSCGDYKPLPDLTSRLTAPIREAESGRIKTRLALPRHRR